MKKILALALAIAVCASMATTALATSGYDKLDPPSSNVDSTGSVKSETVAKDTETAVADAVKAGGTGATAEVVVKNAEAVTPAALKSMADVAAKSTAKVVLMADTVIDGKIQSRLYIDPVKAAAVKEDIKLGVKVDKEAVKRTVEKFSYFENKIAVAKFEQKASFGLTISVAVKLDLTDMDTKNLVFYSYDPVTNKYKPVTTPAYWFDKAGYLHFNTALANDIIISSGALTLKK